MTTAESPTEPDVQRSRVHCIPPLSAGLTLTAAHYAARNDGRLPGNDFLIVDAAWVLDLLTEAEAA